jgi:hypothetical protein
MQLLHNQVVISSVGYALWVEIFLSPEVPDFSLTLEMTYYNVKVVCRVCNRDMFYILNRVHCLHLWCFKSVDIRIQSANMERTEVQRPLVIIGFFEPNGFSDKGF